MPETDFEQRSIFWENQFGKGDDLWYVISGTNDRDGVEELAVALFESGDMQNPPSNDRRVVIKRICIPTWSMSDHGYSSDYRFYEYVDDKLKRVEMEK